MSSQPPYGQGSWQQPPAGPPGQGPGGPPGPPPGPPGPPPGGPGGPPGPPGPPPPGGYPPGGPPPPGGGPPGGPPPPGGPGGPPFGPGGPQPGKSKTPLIAGIIAAVVVLAGVGVLLYFLVFSGDDDEGGGDYCALVEDNKDLFQELMGGSGDGSLEDAVALLHDLRAAAPEEVADELEQLDEPFVELEQALDEQGLSLSDVEDEVPPEAEEAVQEFSAAIDSLDQSAISQTLVDHADQECGVEVQVEE